FCGCKGLFTLFSFAEIAAHADDAVNMPSAVVKGNDGGEDRYLISLAVQDHFFLVEHRFAGAYDPLLIFVGTIRARRWKEVGLRLSNQLFLTTSTEASHDLTISDDKAAADILHVHQVGYVVD